LGVAEGAGCPDGAEAAPAGAGPAGTGAGLPALWASGATPLSSSGAGWAGGAAPLAWWPGPERAPGCAALPADCAIAGLGISAAIEARRPTTAHSTQIR